MFTNMLQINIQLFNHIGRARVTSRHGIKLGEQSHVFHVHIGISGSKLYGIAWRSQQIGFIGNNL
jgi:hypothetical protein